MLEFVIFTATGSTILPRIELSPRGENDWITLSLNNALSLYSIVYLDGWFIGYRYEYDWRVYSYVTTLGTWRLPKGGDPTFRDVSPVIRKTSEFANGFEARKRPIIIVHILNQ